MDRYYKLSQDTIDDFMGVYNKKAFSLDINFEFIGDKKLKNLIKISKLPEDISFVLGKDLKVTINEDLISVFDEESIVILIEQELDKINYNIDSGKIKMVRTDLNTFSSLVNKYGVEKVARANKVEDLYNEQKKDSESLDVLF